MAYGYGLGYGLSYGMATYEGPVDGSLDLTLDNITVVSTGTQAKFGNVSAVLADVSLAAIATASLDVRVFRFPPNWGEGIREIWEYKTEVISARSGREQRIAQRVTPRKTFEFSVAAYGDRRRALDRTFDRYQHIAHAFPDFARRVYTLAEMPAGTGAVPVSAIQQWMSVGVPVFVIAGREIRLRYLGPVDEMAGTVGFGDNLPVAWPAGTSICPAIVGYLDNAIQSRRLTNDVAVSAVRFESKPGYESPLEPDDAPTVYADREVFLEAHNWSEPVQLTFEREVESIDFDRGVVERFAPVGYGSRLTRLAFLNRDRAAADALLHFFARMRGQQGEFWRPTFEPDMTMAASATSGSSNLRVAGTDIYDDYVGSAVFKAVMIQLNDGTRLFRQIANMFVDGANTVLQLTESWPYSVSPADVAMISWMPVCRLAGDAITVEWVTDSKSRCQMTLRTIETLPVEDL